MIKKWFYNRLKTVMEHNGHDFNLESITVDACDKLGIWTPCDLILREYYNNGGGSAKGFLGISTAECIKCYAYIYENQEELKKLNYISKNGYNNSGFLLWSNYKID